MKKIDFLFLLDELYYLLAGYLSLKMSHYTDGFSKDMIKAFNAAKYKVGNFNIWCAEHPGCLTEQQILKVKIALRRARSSNSAYTHRKRQSLRATMLATDIIQLDKKNKLLRKELNNLQQKYNTLLEQVREFIKNNPIAVPETSNTVGTDNGGACSLTAEPTSVIGDDTGVLAYSPTSVQTDDNVFDDFKFTDILETDNVITLDKEIVEIYYQLFDHPIV